MNSVRIPPRLRLLCSRLGSLLLLCQRSPIIQLIFPEAKILGGSAIADTATLAIATVAGLGAYDSVAGATSVVQVAPLANSVIVPAAVGSNLNFVYKISISDTPGSFQIISGTLPTGLTQATSIVSKTQTISGFPSQTGSFPITLKAWEYNLSGPSAVGSFTIYVLGFSTQPAATKTINSGATTTLSCTVTGAAAGATLTYQWYQGTAGTITTPVGTNSASFTTPALTLATNYWVKVSSTLSGSTVSVNSATSAITVNGTVPAAVVTNPLPIIINYGDTTTLNVVASGSVPLTYQWYRGVSGTTDTPVGTNSASFSAGPLTATASYWVNVSNAANPAGAPSATATITTRTPYESWMFVSGSQVPSNQNGPWDTPQQDGVNNLLKYAFNLNPNLSDLRSLTVGAGNVAGLPGMTHINGTLRMEYIRRAASTNPGISYTPQCSPDLTRWTAFPAGQTVTAIGTTGWERVVVDGPVGNPTCIGRVAVEQLP